VAVICRSCGTEIADKAIVCYRCGAPTADPPTLPKRAAPPSRMGLWVTLAVVVLGIVIYLVYFRPV